MNFLLVVSCSLLTQKDRFDVINVGLIRSRAHVLPWEYKFHFLVCKIGCRVGQARGWTVEMRAIHGGGRAEMML